MSNELLQADNKVEIEGILMEKNMEIKEFNTQEGKKKAITGKLDIKTGDNSVHTVEVFSYLLKKDKTENGIAKGLITVMNDYKTVAKEGEANADRVRITSGEIRKNEYIGQDGQLKSYLQYSTNFINRLKPEEEPNSRATFAIETYVQAIVPEIKNDDETGRIIIKGLVPLYGGKVIPLDFIVANKKAVAYIESNYEIGKTVKLKGDIINSIETIKIVEEMAFGDDIEKIITTTTKELLVTGGTPPYDEDNPKAYSAELIKKALVERETYIDGLKAKSEEKKKSSSDANMGGFDVEGGANASNQGDGYDIPF